MLALTPIDSSKLLLFCILSIYLTAGDALRPYLCGLFLIIYLGPLRSVFNQNFQVSYRKRPRYLQQCILAFEAILGLILTKLTWNWMKNISISQIKR